MGAIKWTGKGLKFVGSLLEADEVERWLEDAGKDLLAKQLQKTGMRWLFGKARAKRAVFNEVAESVNRSEPLRTALAARLDGLPTLLANRALDIQRRGPKLLWIKESYGHFLVAVPRALVQFDVRRHLGELASSAELSRYEALPEIFLQRIADDGEAAFFDHITKARQGEPLVEKALGMGTNENYQWGRLPGRQGHYYVACATAYGTKLEDKKARESFIASMTPRLKELKVDLGEAKQDEIDAAVEAFFARSEDENDRHVT